MRRDRSENAPSQCQVNSTNSRVHSWCAEKEDKRVMWPDSRLSLVDSILFSSKQRQGWHLMHKQNHHRTPRVSDFLQTQKENLIWTRFNPSRTFLGIGKKTITDTGNGNRTGHRLGTEGGEGSGKTMLWNTSSYMCILFLLYFGVSWILEPCL